VTKLLTVHAAFASRILWKFGKLFDLPEEFSEVLSLNGLAVIRRRRLLIGVLAVTVQLHGY
jgi:hypothetical protein